MRYDYNYPIPFVYTRHPHMPETLNPAKDSPFSEEDWCLMTEEEQLGWYKDLVHEIYWRV